MHAGSTCYASQNACPWIPLEKFYDSLRAFVHVTRFVNNVHVVHGFVKTNKFGHLSTAHVDKLSIFSKRFCGEAAAAAKTVVVHGYFLIHISIVLSSP